MSAEGAIEGVKEYQVHVPLDVTARLEATANANAVDVETWILFLIERNIEEDALIEQLYEDEVAQRAYECALG